MTPEVRTGKRRGNHESAWPEKGWGQSPRHLRLPHELMHLPAQRRFSVVHAKIHLKHLTLRPPDLICAETRFQKQVEPSAGRRGREILGWPRYLKVQWLRHEYLSELSWQADQTVLPVCPVWRGARTGRTRRSARGKGEKAISTSPVCSTKISCLQVWSAPRSVSMY